MFRAKVIDLDHVNDIPRGMFDSHLKRFDIAVERELKSHRTDPLQRSN